MLVQKRFDRADIVTQEQSSLPRKYGSTKITKNGLALQLTLQGTKYYKDDDLNKK